MDDWKVTKDKKTTRTKEIHKMLEYLSPLKKPKLIVDGLQKIKFDKAKTKYKAEHENKLKQYCATRRKVFEICPHGKYHGRVLDKEYAALEQTHKETYAKFVSVSIRDEYRSIWEIPSFVDKD